MPSLPAASPAETGAPRFRYFRYFRKCNLRRLTVPSSGRRTSDGVSGRIVTITPKRGEGHLLPHTTPGAALMAPPSHRPAKGGKPSGPVAEGRCSQQRHSCRCRATHPHIWGVSGRTRIKQEFRQTRHRSTTGSCRSGTGSRTNGPGPQPVSGPANASDRPRRSPVSVPHRLIDHRRPAASST